MGQLSSAPRATVLNYAVNQVLRWTSALVKASFPTKAFHERSLEPGDKRQRTELVIHIVTCFRFIQSRNTVGDKSGQIPQEQSGLSSHSGEWERE